MKIVLCLTIIFSNVFARQFNNPVLDGDFPDPGVIVYDGKFYATTTNKQKVTPERYPIYESSDAQSWTFVGYALSEPPVWANKSSPLSYWAPEIHQIGENEFRLFFTTREDKSNTLCIGVATSDKVSGPFIPLSEPLEIDSTQGTLDATLVQDGNRKILVWKGSAWVYGRELNEDCLSFKEGSERVSIMRNTLDWEGGVTEGPWYVSRPDGWYLFYSANNYCNEGYSIGVARSHDPFGPFEKLGKPILVADDRFKATGHCSVVPDVKGGVNATVMIYHSYYAGQVCEPYPRPMMAQSVGWGADGWPYMIPN